MIYEVIPMKTEKSSSKAKLTTYLIEHSEEIGIVKRPVVVVCPGGGYEFVSDREAEMVALKLNSFGYHAVILRYSVAPDAEYPTALTELASVFALLRKNAEEWHIDTDKILVQGFSAGGHLAASYGMFWSEPFLAEAVGVPTEMLKPNGMILCYPVITSGEFAHRSSFEKLLGDRYDELVDKMSLETQVNENTPPAFLWHTFTDDCVPVQNSLLLIDALLKKKIPTEFHMYPYGGHGLGLSNKLTANPGGYGIQPDCESWMKLLKVWLENNYPIETI